MATSALLLALLSVLAAPGACDASKPHPHQGILKKFERVHPSKVGVTLDGVSDDELRRGEPVLRMLSMGKGFSRVISCQDVCASEAVVWSAINDLPNYPKMVDGVVSLDVYSEKKEGSAVVTCAKYKITAAGWGISYYMKHIFEPKKHSMTFHLDYDRCSELSDTVGYWYVEALSDGWCRVYYSTDSRLPRFIPGFAKDALMNLAAKRSTTWVEKRCNAITGFKGGGSGGGGGGGLGAALGKLVPPKQVTLLLLLLASVKNLELRTPAEVVSLCKKLLPVG